MKVENILSTINTAPAFRLGFPECGTVFCLYGQGQKPVATGALAAREDRSSG